MNLLGMDLGPLFEMITSFFLAAVVGMAISFRRAPDRYQLSMIEAHAFLSTAAAVLMVIIGSNIYRAVGLLGVASVIRYRYAIRNPRDAGTLIVSLGLGMACGSRMYEIAILGAAFVILVSWVVKWFPEFAPSFLMQTTEEVILRIQTRNYEATMEKINKRLEELGVKYALTSFENKFGEQKGPSTEFDLHIRYPAHLDLQEISKSLMDDQIIRLSWHDLPTPGNY